MLHLHEFECFARAQTCIINIEGKLLCSHSSLVAKVNFCINFNFFITIVMLFLSENSRQTEITILCSDVNVSKNVGRSIVVVT